MNQDTSLQRQLNAIAEAEVPNGSLDLRERIRQQAYTAQATRRSIHSVPRARYLRPAFIAACLLGILALGLQLMPGQVASISAEEALRRAEQTTALGLSGINTLHAVMDIVVPATGSVVREEYWVELPSRMRKETIWPAGSASEEQLQTQVMHGDDTWIWSVPTGQPDAVPDSIIHFDSDEMSSALYIIPNPSASLDSAGQEPTGLCAQPGDQLSMLGEERMFGRTALVIECLIAAEDDAKPLARTRLKLWIDKDLFLVLKAQQYETTGDLFVESAFTQFEVDPAIPAERLEFSPPSGVPIEDASE